MSIDEHIPSGEPVKNKESTEVLTWVTRFRRVINSIMRESFMPTKKGRGFESTVGFYGGSLVVDEFDDVVFDMRRIVSLIDRVGDAILRMFDENTFHNPVAVIRRRPLSTHKIVFPGAKRSRGDRRKVWENIKRLGLQDVYGLHDWGIVIKQPKIFTHGISLQDIFRSGAIGSDLLSQVDLEHALVLAGRYICRIHQEKGAIGEVLVNDIIFRDVDENERVVDPILNIPDILYCPDKKTGKIDRLVTDLLDFAMSVGLETCARSDLEEARKNIRTLIQAYGNEKNEKVIAMLASFVGRGRLNLETEGTRKGFSRVARYMTPITSIHNKSRFRCNKDVIEPLREIIIEECDQFLKDKK